MEKLLNKDEPSMKNFNSHKHAEWRLPPLSELVNDLSSKPRSSLHPINLLGTSDKNSFQPQKSYIPSDSIDHSNSMAEINLLPKDERLSKDSPTSAQNMELEISSYGSDSVFQTKKLQNSIPKKNSMPPLKHPRDFHNSSFDEKYSDSKRNSLESYSLNSKDSINKDLTDFSHDKYINDSYSDNELSGDASNQQKPKNSNLNQFKKYSCNICYASFSRQHNLKSHTLTHSTERPFICDICMKSFRRQHDLKRHKKLHTGERPHTCPTCGRGFARLDALNRHMRAESLQSCSGIPRRGRFMNVHINQGFSLNYQKNLSRNSISILNPSSGKHLASKYINKAVEANPENLRRASTSILMFDTTKNNDNLRRASDRYDFAPPSLVRKKNFSKNGSTSLQGQNSGYSSNGSSNSAENHPSSSNVTHNDPNLHNYGIYINQRFNYQPRRSVTEAAPSNLSDRFHASKTPTTSTNEIQSQHFQDRSGLNKPTSPNVQVFDSKIPYNNLSIKNNQPKSRLTNLRVQEYSPLGLGRRHSLATISKTSIKPDSSLSHGSWGTSRNSISQYDNSSTHPLSYSRETNQESWNKTQESNTPNASDSYKPNTTSNFSYLLNSPKPLISNYSNLHNYSANQRQNFNDNFSSSYKPQSSSKNTTYNITTPISSLQNNQQVRKQSIPTTTNKNLEQENLLLKHELDRLKSNNLHNQISHLENTISELTKENKQLNKKILVYEGDSIDNNGNDSTI
ncbi:Transcriptional regulator CRZ1 [Smittium culicis]|uniref:Transcriptional regulator CRZ1 n=1 Tax=Smittium culicis TaxID=133412 RepID=A0A1R1YPL5_9FUNG|nr:Transcriptional regulator CRZ1 [Smittium culicis]